MWYHDDDDKKIWNLRTFKIKAKKFLCIPLKHVIEGNNKLKLIFSHTHTAQWEINVIFVIVQLLNFNNGHNNGLLWILISVSTGPHSLSLCVT